MHILYLCPVGCIGGAERVLVDCVRQCRRLRPDWHVSVVLFADGPLRQSLSELGARVEVVALPAAVAASGDAQFAGVPDAATSIASGRLWRRVGSAAMSISRGIRFLRFLQQLKRAVAALNPDLIHSAGIKSHLCLAMIHPRSCPVIWHIHDFFSHRTRRVQRLIQFASRRASLGFAISRAVEDDIRIVAPELAIQLLENGVDTERFAPGTPQPETLDLAGGLPADARRVRVGLVGTYAFWKGHDVFLNAIQKCPTVTGYIVGGPIYTTVGSQVTEAGLREQAESLGIADRVGFVGFQANTAWVYQSLDIVVHASVRPEPFGLTIAEAMACGRAVVVSNSGGAAELFTEMHDAVGHQSGNRDSLADAIQRLADDPALRERLGRNARQSALRRFAADQFGDKLLDAYLRVLRI